MSYGYKTQIQGSFQEAINKVTAQLKKEGFGVLTKIDVKSTLKKKLDVEFDNYCILGACNPPFAYKVLQTEIDIGLLLPCNVIVYEDSDKDQIVVPALLPTIAMSMIENPDLKQVAIQVEEKLKNVIDSL